MIFLSSFQHSNISQLSDNVINRAQKVSKITKIEGIVVRVFAWVPNRLIEGVDSPCKGSGQLSDNVVSTITENYGIVLRVFAWVPNQLIVPVRVEPLAE